MRSLQPSVNARAPPWVGPPARILLPGAVQPGERDADGAKPRGGRVRVEVGLAGHPFGHFPDAAGVFANVERAGNEIKSVPSPCPVEKCGDVALPGEVRPDW